MEFVILRSVGLFLGLDRKTSFLSHFGWLLHYRPPSWRTRYSRSKGKENLSEKSSPFGKLRREEKLKSMNDPRKKSKHLSTPRNSSYWDSFLVRCSTVACGSAVRLISFGLNGSQRNWRISSSEGNRISSLFELDNLECNQWWCRRFFVLYCYVWIFVRVCKFALFPPRCIPNSKARRTISRMLEPFRSAKLYFIRWGGEMVWTLEKNQSPSTLLR